MLRRLRAYLAVLRTQLRNVSHFRANVVAWVLYSPLQLGIIVLLWRIVYSGTGTVGSFRFRDMVLYYLVVHFLRRVIEPVQAINYEVWTEINQGSLDVYLARPISFGPYIFFRALGTPVMELAVGVPFFLAFSWLLGLPIQHDPRVLAVFLTSAAAGFVILFLIQFLIGSLTFWFERIFGIRDMIFSAFMLFSGQLIPISILPKPIVAISHYLPFEGIYFIPATIYAQGHLGPDVAAHLLRQVIWITGLCAAIALAWSRGIARYASQGG